MTATGSKFNGVAFKSKARNPGPVFSNCGSGTGLFFFRTFFSRSFLFWERDLGTSFRFFVPADVFPFVPLVVIEFPGDGASQELPINPPMDPFTALNARSRSFTAVKLDNWDGSHELPSNPPTDPFAALKSRSR